MANPGFELFIENLDSIGAFDVFLPLLLFLAIYFGLLKKTEAIGDDDAVIGVASLAMAFLTVFGVLTIVPASVFPQFFGVLAVVLIAILSAVISMGLVGFEFGPEGHRYAQIAALGVGLLVLVVAAPSVVEAFVNINIGGLTITEEAWSWIATIVMMAIMGGVVWLLVKGNE